MSSENTQNDGVGHAIPNQSSTTVDSRPIPDTNKRGLSKYLLIIGIAAVMLVVYYTLLGVGGQSPSSKQVSSNNSISGLNQVHSLFLSDLEKSENISSLQISYYFNPPTTFINSPTYSTLEATGNLTIDSYELGNYQKTVITNITTYRDLTNGAVIMKDVNNIYHYNTNITLTCVNDTIYSSTAIINSSLQCSYGDQNLSYIELTPFTAVNVSPLINLEPNQTVAYSSTMSVLGRKCDNFIISNANSSGRQLNYSVFYICIDTQYGIPLYFNLTTTLDSFAYTATSLSTYVSSSAFIIPQQYLNAITP